jgi:hypothetical protein
MILTELSFCWKLLAVPAGSDSTAYIAAVFMKQSSDTCVSVGIAASEKYFALS